MGALLEISILLMLVILNGLLAGSEFAIVASRKATLHQRAQAGDVGANRALALAESPSTFLSTVQIGITAVAVAAGAFGGTRIAQTLAPGLEALGFTARLAAETAVILVVATITYVTVVVGELVPKRIALRDPERMAARAAGPMLILSRLATPVVRLLRASSDLVLRLLSVKDRPRHDVAEEDIRSMIAHAAATGVIEATEQQIVERLFRLSDETIGMIMTPRERIVWLDRGAPPAEWRRRLGDIRHTRYLVAEGSLDRHVGYVMVRDLLRAALADEPLAVERLLHRPHVLPTWTPVFRLLERFQWSGDHMAVVTGDHGEVVGLVTLTDVLEGLLGDVPEVQAVVVPGVVRREDGSWLVDGRLPLGEFLAAAGRRDSVPPEAPTVHAFMVRQLGEPALASVVERRGLRFEVVDMDGSRVDKVLVTEVPARRQS